MSGFHVYEGREGGKIVYIGTTTQTPEDRFRWHRNNGKNLNFRVIKECKDSDEMLSLEYDLIKKHHPVMNKIKERKQNLNIALSGEALQRRVGDKEWCQCCLKRRVNSGYARCYFCSWEGK